MPKMLSETSSIHAISLLTKIRGSTCTIIAIKATTDGTIFGSFTSTPWRLQNGWFGDVGEAFLFRSLEGNIDMEVYLV